MARLKALREHVRAASVWPDLCIARLASLLGLLRVTCAKTIAILVLVPPRRYLSAAIRAHSRLLLASSRFTTRRVPRASFGARSKRARSTLFRRGCTLTVSYLGPPYELDAIYRTALA